MNSLSSLPRLSRVPEEKKLSGRNYLELLDNSLSSSERSEISPYIDELSESLTCSSSLTDGEKSEVSAESQQAMWLLNLAGCRIIRQQAGFSVAIWEDLDGPELRDAIRAVGMGDQPVVHLEGPNVPMRYKVRNCPDRKTNESFASWMRRARGSSHLPSADGQRRQI